MSASRPRKPISNFGKRHAVAKLTKLSEMTKPRLVKVRAQIKHQARNYEKRLRLF